MINTNRLYLIGMPGSGKTTIGNLLSQKLNLTFIDLDAVILKNHTNFNSINEIFEIKGENFFRQIEKKNLRLISNDSCILIATGGGTPCFFDNIDFMLSSGLTVFLNPDLYILHAYIVQEKKKRPLFKNKTDDELYYDLKKMYKKRLRFYNKAHIVINPIYFQQTFLL